MPNYKFKELEDFFPNNIVAYRTEKKKDALFYSLAAALGTSGYNTKPESVTNIAEDKKFAIYAKEDVLTAQLLLTYFEKTD